MCQCVSNTTVKMMKQGNHISLRQGFNQAKKREERGAVAVALSHYMQLWGWDVVVPFPLSHDKLTASRTR